jgi:hypothetical protein
MTPQTASTTGNPWGALLARAGDRIRPRRRYYFEHLKPGKRLYMESERVRSAAQALRQFLKRNGIAGRVTERTMGRPCIWWEMVN